jgi:DNA end-binding protein Ku
MRAIGSLTLKFGLINIPMKVSSFLDYQGVGFRQICSTCKSAVNERKWCFKCNKSLTKDDLESGLQLSKNSIMPVDKSLIKVNTETRIVAITELNLENEFLTNKCYLLMPSDDLPTAYYLLDYLLHSIKKQIVVEYALRQKLELGIIKPILINGTPYLLLKKILYADAIKSIKPLEATQPSGEELELAKDLLLRVAEKLPKVNFQDLKDGRRELLQKIVSGEITATSEVRTEIKIETNLLEQLKDSVAIMEEKPKKEKKENDT